jgi:hypothetical protein
MVVPRALSADFELAAPHDGGPALVPAHTCRKDTHEQKYNHGKVPDG